MPKYQASCDFAYCDTLEVFFTYLDKFPGTRIMSWVTNGPGGGNPCVTLEFDSIDQAVTYLKSHHDTDDDLWCKGFLTIIS
jgi:hypothetical protein